MQIRKTYQKVKPELLFDEVKDFVLKQGVVVDEQTFGTYSQPGDSSSFIARGTLTFKAQGEAGRVGKECLRAHFVSSSKGDTKLMLDVDEKLFAKEKVAALQEDLSFIFGSYEVKGH